MKRRNAAEILQKYGIQPAGKRFNIDTGGTMRGFLPAPLADQVVDYINELNVMRRVVTTYPMASRRLDIPIIIDQMNAYRAPDGTDAQAQNFTTETFNIEAKKLMVQSLVDREVFEDSQIEVQPRLLQQYARAMANAEENMLTLGDTAHAATAATVAAATEANWFTYDPRTMFDGVWTLAQADATHTRGAAATAVDGGGLDISYTHIQRAVYNLGKYVQNAGNGDIACLVDDWQAGRLKLNDDIKTASLTGLKTSPIISGELAVIFGVPIVEVPKGSNTVAVVIYRPYALFGDRRKIRIETEQVPASDQTRFVASERIAFTYALNEALCAITDLSSPSSSSS